MKRLLLLTLGLLTLVAPASAQTDLLRAPYLQLGDAPLVGYPGSETDQVQVMWQADHDDPAAFLAFWRRVGEASWQRINEIEVEAVDTGRFNFSVTIDGLDFDEMYEYGIRHGSDIYRSKFRTRLAPADPTPFTFAAYGDSADPDHADDFNDVLGALNSTEAAFAVLLGDNAYDDGRHSEFDVRFDPSTSLEAIEWSRSHIDYAAIGNHEMDTEDGWGHRATFASPQPIAGVSGPATPPSGFFPEHNFSFDYGMVHFTVLDSNERSRVDELADWAAADLAASDARWKVVVAHRPTVGAPDKDSHAGESYYRELIPMMKEQGVDLLLVGHSHAFSWTHPLTGFDGDEPTYVFDPDGVFAEDAGVVQLISGVGGHDIRNVREPGWPQPWVAAGYAEDTEVPAEFGFALIDVTWESLSVEYRAVDGTTIDFFSIVDDDPPPLPPEPEPIPEPEPDPPPEPDPDPEPEPVPPPDPNPLPKPNPVPPPEPDPIPDPDQIPGRVPAVDIGMFNVTTGNWSVSHADGRNETFFFGDPGDRPLYGDWDCDGRPSVGMYRESDGYVYLRNENIQGTADIEFFLGMAGDLPVAGDWDGDGCDTISIYRPSTGQVFISDRLGTAIAGDWFFFGTPDDTPFAGDFDGDGTDTIGLHREKTGYVYLRNEITSGVANIAFYYGAPRDVVLGGDWNGDGRDTVGAYRAPEGVLYLRNENNYGPADIQLPAPGPGMPVAG